MINPSPSTGELIMQYADSLLIRQVLTVVAILLVTTGMSIAQWKPCEGGPWGGPVSSMVTIGKTVLAGTYQSGVYAISAGDTLWKNASNGLTRLGITSLACNGTTLCALADGTVFRADSTLQWIPFSTGLPVKPVECITFCGNRIVAGTRNAGVYMTSADSADWKPINGTFLADKLITAVAAKGDTLFTAASGIFRSVDFGTTWTPINTSYYYQREINALAVTDSGLFAGAGSEIGVIFTRNGGATWNKSPARYIRSLGVVNGTVFAGTTSDTILTSVNHGTTWEPLAITGSMSAYGFTSYDSILYIGTMGSGVITSVDNFESWKKINTGMRNKDIISLAVNGNTLYAAVNGDVVISSSDRGKQWTSVNAGLSNFVPRTLLMYHDHLFAGTTAGVYALGIDSSSWNFRDRFSTYPVMSLGKSEKRIYAGAYREGAFFSADDGVTWETIDNIRSQTSVYSFAECNGTVFAGTSLGVYRIADSSTTWTEVNTGLPATPDVQALAVHKNKLFAAVTLKGIFCSEDSGTTWSSSGDGLDTGMIFTDMMTLDSCIIVTTMSDGIFHSVNGGKNWTSIDTGLENRPTHSLQVLGDELFAGTSSGVWHRPLGELTRTPTGGLRKRESPAGAHVNLRVSPNSGGRLTVTFCNPETDHISLGIYDLYGRKIAQLADGKVLAGEHHYCWQNAETAQGYYFIVLKSGNRGRTALSLIR